VAVVPSIDEIADRHPLEISDKRSEALLTPVKIDSMTKSMCGLDPGYTRLPGIDLPRVDVKDIGHPGAQDRAHALKPQWIRNQPEVTASAPGDS
jgi:hypothetical protein